MEEMQAPVSDHALQSVAQGHTARRVAAKKTLGLMPTPRLNAHTSRVGGYAIWTLLVSVVKLVGCKITSWDNILRFNNTRFTFK